LSTACRQRVGKAGLDQLIGFFERALAIADRRGEIRPVLEHEPGLRKRRLMQARKPICNISLFASPAGLRLGMDIGRDHGQLLL
jgi:hypothetical protein